MEKTRLLITVLWLAAFQLANAQCKVSKIYTLDGLNEISICPQDGLTDVINFTNDDDSDANYAYAIANASDEIIHIELGNSFDFDPLTESKYYVWGFSYTGNIVAQLGEDIFDADFSDDCFKMSRTAIKVKRDQSTCEAASMLECKPTVISTSNGETQTYTCTQDGTPDIITFFNNDNTGANYAYVFINDDGLILRIESGNSFDFDPALAGKTKIWGVSYTGDIRAEVGDRFFSTDFSNGCWARSKNAIKVIREDCGGGVSSAGLPFISEVHYSDAGPDDDEKIEVTAPAGTDLTGYTLVLYNGNNAKEYATLNLPEGVVTVADSGDGCGVVCVEATIIQNGDPDGIALVDGNGNVIEFISYGGTLTAEDDAASGLTSRDIGVVETDDDVEGMSLQLTDTGWVGPMTNSMGTVNAGLSCAGGSNGGGDMESCLVEGGTITGGPFEFCVEDGIEDRVSDIILSDNSGSESQWVITDEAGIILGLPDMPSSVDFEGAGVGVCLIWHLSYEGQLEGAAIGANAADLEGCFELSNPIEVNRVNTDGGTINTESGVNVKFTCTGDGVDDILVFENNSNSTTSNYIYVITDEQNTIVELLPTNNSNFEGKPVGTNRIWGLSYTGNITAGVGDNAATTVLSDGCFDLTDNFITVIGEDCFDENCVVDGGVLLALPNEMVLVTICAGDGFSDAFDVSLEGTVGTNSAWVITDEVGNILDLAGRPPFNLENAGVGVCLIWHLSYEDGLEGVAVGANAADLRGCFDLSNPIAVTRTQTEAEGGTVTTLAGETEIFVQVNDGEDDIVEFVSSEVAGEKFGYVVTDEQNIIIGLPTSNRINFEETSAGICRVWGLSYYGNIKAKLGDNAAEVALSDGCFDLSDNFVTVNRNIALFTDDALFRLNPNQNASNLEQIKISPNPASDKVYIDLNITDEVDFEKTIVSIYSTMGQLVKQQIFASAKGENRFQMDLSNINQGLYQMVIQNGQTIKTNAISKVNLR